MEMQALDGKNSAFGAQAIYLLLSKHTDSKEQAAARIGLFWRNRVKIKALRYRIDKLLEIQAPRIPNLIRFPTALSKSRYHFGPGTALVRGCLGR